MLRKFLNSQGGNTVLLVALSLFPIILLLGGAVDITRANTAKVQLKSAIDGAALAAASLSQQGATDEVVRDYVEANLATISHQFTNLDVDISSNRSESANEVTVKITAQMPTAFLGLIDHAHLEITAESTAQHAITNTELAVVLDISSSMRGAKVANLRDAAEDFVEEMFEGEQGDTTSINLVPFGGTVNVGDDVFARFAANENGIRLDPTETRYSQGFDVPSETFRFTNGDTCLEYGNNFYNDRVLSLGDHGQVPHFWRWWNTHPWCPGDASRVVFNSNDEDDLTDSIRNMTLSDGTGMNIGAMWGLKSLSPAWQGDLGGDFSDRPAAYNDADTLKAMVIMTDGEITEQNRPEDFTIGNVHTNRAFNAVPNVNSFSNQGNRNNMQTVLRRGNSNSASTTDTAVGQFRRVCNQARDNGIVVYTIGFQIRRGGLSETLLRECATDPTKFFFVEGLNIETAFEEIAASLSQLRITG